MEASWRAFSTVGFKFWINSGFWSTSRAGFVVSRFSTLSLITNEISLSLEWELAGRVLLTLTGYVLLVGIRPKILVLSSPRRLPCDKNEFSVGRGLLPLVFDQQIWVVSIKSLLLQCSGFCLVWGVDHLIRVCWSVTKSCIRLTSFSWIGYSLIWSRSGVGWPWGLRASPSARLVVLLVFVLLLTAMLSAALRIVWVISVTHSIGWATIIPMSMVFLVLVFVAFVLSVVMAAHFFRTFFTLWHFLALNLAILLRGFHSACVSSFKFLFF